jgi:HEAT repeat protein
MKTMNKLAATVLLVLATSASPALAGKGGSAAQISQAIHSGSVDAIIAEVEKTEGLMCDECIQLVTNLTEDSRYEVREVAGWWFAKRPALAEMLVEQYRGELANGSSTAVRNAADFLGSTRTLTALPNLRAAIDRGGLDVQARLALVRAAGSLAHKDGNYVLARGMADRDATVRMTAVKAWRDVLGQTDASAVVALLTDADSTVRQAAATVVGGMHQQSGRAALEALVVGDADAFVRRNAAWALGQLGSNASRAALTKASGDASGLVRMTAKVALGQLH